MAVLSQLSMDHGGVGLFPVVYDDTVDDFDEEAGYFWINLIFNHIISTLTRLYIIANDKDMCG